MKNGERINNMFPSCWDYFNCPIQYCMRCKAYLHFKELNNSSELIDCWFLVDSQDGGPAKRGPCINCPVFKNQYPELSALY